MSDLQSAPEGRSPGVTFPQKGTNSVRGRSLRVVISFAVAFLVLNLGTGLLLDFGPRHLRDPEYGLRLNSIREHQAEFPNRPLIVVVGSSRTAMGVRPSAVESGSGPLLLNMSLSGAGPLSQLLTLRRLEADGITPAVVVLEYWPPFFRGDGAYREENRLNSTRFFPQDLSTLDEFFHEPIPTKQRWRESRWLPFWAHRKPLKDRFAPGWLPHTERADAMFANIDDWGWLPGRETSTESDRDKGWPHVFGYYWPLFRFYSVDPDQDRALRACIAHCRERGIGITLAYLPESDRFRTLKTPEAVQLAEDHLTTVRRETGVPLIDARAWITDDESLPDGYHLTRSAATTFTKRFVQEINSLKK